MTGQDIPGGSAAGGRKLAVLDDPQLQALSLGLELVLEEISSLVEPLDEEQLFWSPGEGVWSVAQCLDHLRVTAEKYAARLDPAVTEARERPPTSESGPWKMSFTGKLVLRAVAPTSRLKVPAPAVFHPSPSPDPGVIREFERAYRDIGALLASADGLPLTKLGIRSPVSRLIHLSLFDAFILLVRHAERHVAQVRRLILRRGFPGRTG
jgi:hypothetical protein